MHGWWECRLVQLLWKTVWAFLKKLKMELVHDTAILIWVFKYLAKISVPVCSMQQYLQHPSHRSNASVHQ